MGNAPPEGMAPKDDAEAAQWAAEDAQAQLMPRYVPVASLDNYERPTMHQIRDMFQRCRGRFSLPKVDASYDVDLLGGGGGARCITTDVNTLSVKQLKALISAAGLHRRLYQEELPARACGRGPGAPRADLVPEQRAAHGRARATAAGGPRRHLPRRQALSKVGPRRRVHRGAEALPADRRVVLGADAFRRRRHKAGSRQDARRGVDARFRPLAQM